MLWLRICSPDKSILGKTRLTGGVELHLTFCGTDHCTFNHYPIFFPVTVGVPCVYSFTSGDLFCKQYLSVLQWQRNLGRVVILLCSCLQHNTDKKTTTTGGSRKDIRRISSFILSVLNDNDITIRSKTTDHPDPMVYLHAQAAPVQAVLFSSPAN